VLGGDGGGCAYGCHGDAVGVEGAVELGCPVTVFDDGCVDVEPFVDDEPRSPY
jgi:hypothetical protein